jgi:hypothetical protein
MSTTSHEDWRSFGAAKLRGPKRRRGARTGAGWFFAVCLLLPFANEALAQAAPPQWLLGKSIDLQWRLGRSFEPVHEGEGQTHTDVVGGRASIYKRTRADIR